MKKGQEELSDSILKDLFRKIQDQDEKIVALEAKSMLDYEDLTSKITTLEAKLRDSHSKQKRFESTIKKLYGIIADMKKKPKTMKRSMLKPLRFSGKSGLIDAKSDLETVNVIKKLRQVVQNRFLKGQTKQTFPWEEHQQARTFQVELIALIDILRLFYQHYLTTVCRLHHSFLCLPWPCRSITRFAPHVNI